MRPRFRIKHQSGKKTGQAVFMVMVWHARQELNHALVAWPRCLPSPLAVSSSKASILLMARISPSNLTGPVYRVLVNSLKKSSSVKVMKVIPLTQGCLHVQLGRNTAFRKSHFPKVQPELNFHLQYDWLVEMAVDTGEEASLLYMSE